MIRKLLATTAIVSIATLSGTGAWAQDAKPGEQMNIEFTQTQLDNSHLASKLIGTEVYSSAAADAESIGEIEDLVLADDGMVDSVVIAVGGFLGVGEKDVAIKYDTLEWSDRDNERIVVLSTTREQLEAAPAFEYAAVEEPEKLPDTQTSAVERMDQNQPSDAAGQPREQIAEGGNMAEQPQDRMADNSRTSGDAATQGSPADLKTPDFSAMATATPEQVTAENLVGTTVYGSDDNNIGEVGDLVLSKDGTVDAVILDVGGFLGIGEKPVAIGFEALEILANENGDLVLRTGFTQDQLEAAPEFDENAYESERDSMRLTMNSSMDKPAETAPAEAK